MDTKERILKNRFIERLRMEVVVDQEEYKSLCTALGALAKEWKSKSLVDKKLASELFVLASVTRNMAEDIAQGNQQIKHKVEEIATELDALVGECLHTPEAPP